VEPLEQRIAPAIAFAVTSANALIRFDTAEPDEVITIGPITGLVGGDTIIGIDIRPATGELFGLGSGSRLYKIDLTTAAATQVGADGQFTLPPGQAFGFDFNPTVDRIRITSDFEQNFRLNPNNGTRPGGVDDTTLTYPGQGSSFDTGGAAYTNNFGGSTTTTLFDIDTTNNNLVMQGGPNGTPSPNGGVLTTVGALGINPTDDLTRANTAFDIVTTGTPAAPVNTGFATLTTDGTSSGLYTINLSTGAATLVGSIGAAPTLVRGLALVPEITTPTLYAIDSATNNLVRFNAGNPATIVSSTPISGLVGGDTIIGIDFRPATGELFGLGSGSRLYVINKTTGAAVQRGSDGQFTLPPGVEFGFDFNPTVDRIRVISDTEQNFRLNPIDGTMVDGNTGVGGIQPDSNLAYPGAGDSNSGANPAAGGAAYTNNFAGATTTTLFDIDTFTNSLVRQGGVDGTPSPNLGALNTVGALGINPTDDATRVNTAFDILTTGTPAAPVNTAFAALTTNGTTSALYTIDLATGAATQVGATPIGGAAPLLVRGLAAAPAGSFVFSAPTYSVGESGPVATITINRLIGSDGIASVQFNTSDGTATAPSDYADSDQTVVFGPGVTSQLVTIPLVSDAIPENNETLNLALTNPTNGTSLGAQSTAVLTITDDDGPGPNAFGVDAANNLVRFNLLTPGTIVTTTPITGLQGGETVLGFDFRPADNTLFALGSTSRLYQIDQTTAVATQVGSGTFAIPLSGTSFGFDFNPTVDRIRVVSDTNQNLRLNPNDGTVVDSDSGTAGIQADLNLAYAAGDPHVGANPNLAGSAYLNSVNLATTTTLYGIDSNLDILVIQNPPNNGTLNTVGALGVDATAVLGFDIRNFGAGADSAYATLVVGGTPGLYSIDLASGTASLIGTIGGGATLGALAVAPTAFTASLVANTATFTGSVAADRITFDQSGGLLRHNRFSAGDLGFSSDFDFDPTTVGDQTLSATNPAVVINVAGGSADDRLTVGSASAPASGLAVTFSFDGQGGGDTLQIEDGADATARAIGVVGATSAITGLGGQITYANLERANLNAGSGGDTITITGTTAALTSINAGGGNDTVVFGDGASLRGGLLDGGTGTNSLDYSAWTSPVSVDLSAAQAQTLFLATLSGAQEPSPLSSSQGSGLGVFTLNTAQTALTFSITAQGVTGATVTGNHFHNAPLGVNGAIVRGLTAAEQIDITPPDEVLAGTWTSTDAPDPLTGTLVTELLANRIYFNTHTNPNFPSGELRGQLISQGTVGLATGTGGARGFDNITGGTKDDFLVAGPGTGTVSGGAGADTLGAGGGNDTLLGQMGNDTLRVTQGDGQLTLTGAEDTDTIDFSLAGSGVVFDLDSLGFPQAFNGTATRVTMTDRLENLTGSPFNDIIRVDAQPFPQFINGGAHTLNPPGDRLIVNALGQSAMVQRSDADTGVVNVAGSGTIAFDLVESVQLENPAPGGFLTPGPSNAFNAGMTYSLGEGVVPPAKPGKGAKSIAVGDIDGDLVPDIVTANSVSNNLSILRGNGNGTFGLPTNILSGGTKPSDLALSDIDGDLDLDLVVTNQGSKSIAVLKNNGLGVFGTPVVTPLKVAPRFLAVANLGGSALPDVVVTQNTGFVVVLLTQAGGVLPAAPAAIPVGGTGTSDVVIADFNADGDADIAVANTGSGSVSFLENAGAGVFNLAPQVFKTGSHPNSLAVADFNNDGKQDLAVSHAVSRFVGVLLGNGAALPPFQPVLRVNFPGRYSPSSIAAGDFNGDGNADLALGPRTGGKVRVMLGGGQGAFTQPFEFDLGLESQRIVAALALADVDLNGSLDIITANTSTSDDVSVLLRNQS
jgi:hypothetical protein